MFASFPMLRHHYPRLRQLCILLVCVQALLCAVSPASAQTATKRILVLHGMWQMGEWQAAFDEYYRKEVQERTQGQIDLRFHHLGVKQTTDLDQYDTLFQGFEKKLQEEPVDLIVGVLPSATHFLSHLEKAHPEIPVLYVLPGDFQASELLSRPHHAVVQSSFREALRMTLQRMVEFHPLLDKLVVVAGESENDRVYLERTRQVLEAFRLPDQVQLEYLVGLPLDQLQEQVAGLEQDSVVLFVTFDQDRAGRHYLHEDVVQRLSVSSRVPVYAVVDSLLGYGVVGGVMSRSRGYAEAAADFSLQILEARGNYRLHSPGDKVIETYDWRQLERWKIPSSSLPEGSRVQYQPETVWYEYRGTAMTTLAILLLQAALIAMLVVLAYRDRSARLRLDKSTQYYRSVVTSMSEGVAIQDRDGNILEHNRAAEHILRLSSAEIMARSSFDPRWQSIRTDGSTLPGEEHPAMVALHSGQPVENAVMGLRREDGTTTWLEVSCQPINLWRGSEAAVVTTFKDITLQRERQLAAEMHQRRLDNLFQLSQMEEASEQEIKDFALEASREITASGFGYLYLVDDDQQTLRLVSGSERGLGQGMVVDPEVRYRQEEIGLCGEALRQRCPVITNDGITQTSREKGLPGGHVPVSRYLSLPLLIDGKAVLVAGLANKVEPYDESDLQSLELVMTQMWRLLEQRRLRRETLLTKKRFKTFLDAMPAIAFTIDSQGRFQFRNRLFLEQFGHYDERQLVRGEGPLFAEGEAAQFRRDYERFVAGETVKREITVDDVAGERVFNLHRFPMQDADGETLLIGGIAEDVTERKAIEETLLFISREGWQGAEEDFFTELVRFLAERLGVAYCFVDQVNCHAQKAFTLGLYAHGEVVENIEYDLRGTPCANVSESQSCYYPENIQQQFPEDVLLVEMQAEGYAGIPLRNTRGEVIGILGVMDTAPLRHRELIMTLLRQASGRAAAEIERCHALQVLRESEERFRHLSEEFQTLLDAVPDVILLLDSERRVKWANAAALRSLGPVENLEETPCYELEPCRETFCRLCVSHAVLSSGKVEEKTMRTEEGHEWEVRAFPILNPDGSVRNVLEMRSDISEKQRLRD